MPPIPWRQVTREHGASACSKEAVHLVSPRALAEGGRMGLELRGESLGFVPPHVEGQDTQGTSWN